jgi:hypothetical protein
MKFKLLQISRQGYLFRSLPMHLGNFITAAHTEVGISLRSMSQW